MVIAKPYAAAMFVEFLKYNTMPQQPRNSIIFIPAMNNCPLASVGYLIFIFGQRFKRIASEMSVNEPEINAWLAIIAAVVAITIPMSRNQSGIKLKSTFNVSVLKLCPLKCDNKKAPWPK